MGQDAPLILIRAIVGGVFRGHTTEPRLTALDV